MSSRSGSVAAGNSAATANCAARPSDAATPVAPSASAAVATSLNQRSSRAPVASNNTDRTIQPAVAGKYDTPDAPMLYTDGNAAVPHDPVVSRSRYNPQTN